MQHLYLWLPQVLHENLNTLHGLGEVFRYTLPDLGQEFSLISFSDGKHLAHMPPVQDHKRAFVGDNGPNTGGMGSYTDANHLLPFLNKNDIATAQKINEEAVKALYQEFNSF